MEYIRKAMDTVVGANYERKDLSAVISLKDGFQRPILQSIGQTKAKGKTHYWLDLGYNAPTGSTASYNEGDKPKSDNNAPGEHNNLVARFGKVARVTDTMAAIWTGSGSYRLAEGELERLYQEAIDLETVLKTQEVLNEIEWCMVNGDTTNNATTAGSEVSQFNGILKYITTNVTANGTATDLTEAMVRDLARQIAAGKPVMFPNKLYVTYAQKAVMNNWKQIVYTTEPTNQKAGYSIKQYDTGYFVVDVEIHPWLQTGTMFFAQDNLMKRADLIALGAEPLARINTSLERMITSETTLELRAEKVFGKITGLNQ